MCFSLVSRSRHRTGRLLPGGEPDFHSISVNVINDWQRGKLPFFVAPPLADGETPQSVAAEPTVKATLETVSKTPASLDESGDGGEEGTRTKGRVSKREEAEQEEDLAAIEAEEEARLASFQDEMSEEGDSSGDEGVSPDGAEGGQAEKSSVPREEADDHEDSDSSDDDGGDEEESGSGAVAPGTKGRTSVPSKTRKGKGPAAPAVRSKGGGKSKRGFSDMEACEEGADVTERASGRRKRKRGEGGDVAVDSSGEEEGVEDEEDQGDEDVPEDDDGAMPSIGDGLNWDDLS